MFEVIPMRRYFLVEADTEMASLFCYELTREPGYSYSGTPKFKQISQAALFNKCDREVFFGTLNSLCVSKKEIPEQRMELTMVEKVDQVVGYSERGDAVSE